MKIENRKTIEKVIKPNHYRCYKYLKVIKEYYELLYANIFGNMKWTDSLRDKITVLTHEEVVE